MILLKMILELIRNWNTIWRRFVSYFLSNISVKYFPKIAFVGKIYRQNSQTVIGNTGMNGLQAITNFIFDKYFHFHSIFDYKYLVIYFVDIHFSEEYI